MAIVYRLKQNGKYCARAGQDLVLVATPLEVLRGMPTPV